ncbi:MAG: asparagine synthase (glutamine-hydrolyzing) [Deltaproteobacteria bacterium]|nr:asparagine synthase (glutamine-hydrolyzing) [Deltaproteobacteria bacterium]
MCGICGFIGRGDLEDLRRMNESLAHRGPDGEGLWHDGKTGVYLGHKRLSVIDLEGGAQPMWTWDGRLGVVFNGEIYNHGALREELEKEGHRFLTDHSDTEVLLHGYRQWGQDMVGRLNGMWAFALYDREKGVLFLSRDRFGKKPLFYTLQNGTFAFSSELRSLMRHSALSNATSSRALKKYFAYGYIPAPHSLYERVYKLPGGHNLVLDGMALSFTLRKYWDFVLEPFEDVPPHPEEEWGAELRLLLQRAVERRLISDVPLGVFLSGGIDSSAVTALAARGPGGENLKTFSIGFREASFDESRYARAAADLFRTEHHQKILSMEKARDLLPEIMARLDEPMGDNSLLPTYLLCRETRKHVTVALGGDGGDELFAGYDPFRALKLAKLYSTIVPKPVHQAIAHLVARLPVSHRNMSLDFRLKRTLRGLSYPRKLWNPTWLGPLEPGQLDILFQEPTDLEDVYEEAIRYWEDCPQKDMVDKTLQFYTKLYLQDDILVKVDRASMMHSLEVRAPFLDMELVDFVRRIPHAYKYRNGQTKYLLKKALAPVLSRDILYRAKKGFGAPVGKWFHRGLLDIPARPAAGSFNPLFIRRAGREHILGKHDHRAFLWNLWVVNAFDSN